MESNFANRLITARKMAGLSLQNLADRLGNVVSKQSLNKYEQGKMKPDSDLLISLSSILNVPVDFFFSEPSVAVDLTNVDFRKYSSKLSKTELEAVEEKAKEAFERYFELENILNLKEPASYFDYPLIVSNAKEAEEAAKALRNEWNLGYDPIPDVVDMLEDKGYKVVEIEAPDSFDGLKANAGNQRVVVLRKTLKDDDLVRKRFTALHELAHHSLTFPEGTEPKVEEKLCHSFACALLYPEDMARKDLHKERFHFYQNELIFIKERWGISFPAIFSRALQLGIINDYVYKQLHLVYRKRKLHETGKEPGRYLSKEKPIRFERLIYLALGKELISVNEAAYFTGTSVWRFREQMQPMV
ncbi:MAG: XRE family transcriptional regulator [Marinilabiliales bacterium]|nr:XRE family transcriptional regulator [Marinilabiliales bacterium]